MRKKTNDAMNAVVKDLSELPGGTALEVSLHTMELISVIASAESDLHDCVNELCYQCGKYHTAFEGSCDGCRWLAVKEGFRD